MTGLDVVDQHEQGLTVVDLHVQRLDVVDPYVKAAVRPHCSHEATSQAVCSKRWPLLWLSRLTMPIAWPCCRLPTIGG